MDELEKKLKEIKITVVTTSEQLPAYQVGQLSGESIEQIKQAFTDAGWLPPGDKSVYEKASGKLLSTWVGPDSVKSVGIDQVVEPSIAYDKPGDRYGESLGLVTGRQWLDKTLKAIYEFQNNRDYFRSDKQFKESTITMAELEKLLQKASGIA